MSLHAFPVLVLCAALVAAEAVLVPVQAAAPRQQEQPQAPTFRSSVDLVAVDVQVVSDDGTPIADLGPGDFEVSISGKRRRVISADYVRSSTVDGRPFTPTATGGAVATNVWPLPDDQRAGRIYILAFDISSLSVGDSRAVAGSAKTFIDRLLPSDLVGLYTFPIGTLIEPTSEHAAVRRALDNVVGSTAQGLMSRFHLSVSEIIDINSESAGSGTGVLASVAARECPEFGSGCLDQIGNEAKALGFYLEGRATETLHGLRRLIDVLREHSGRKTVVLFSSGMPTSDRAGGRPDVGDLPRTLGQDAAAMNTTIYTIFVDTTELRAMAAETRRLVGSPVTRSRDRAVGSRIMEEFTGASGGAFMPVMTGSGEYALSRVLRETSSHYLLGVEPDPVDRDGRLRPLRVKVAHDDATIRSRMWVVVPKTGS
jgi:VWFA-related protein